MGLDAILKRYFPAVICLLIASAAYLQASGMGELVAGSVLLDPSSMPPPPPPPKSGASHSSSGQERTVNAGPILSRNPFDSVTGPLDGKPLDLPSAPEAPAPDNSDPYNDPVCDIGKVLLITQSEDPDWSFAAIAGSDGKAQLRRRGDDVSGHQIFWIGWDRVWLTSGSSRCQMQVHGEPPKKLASASPAPSTEAPKPKGKGKAVPKEIADKIHKVSENQFDVERSVVDQILENQAELMRSARIVPEKEGDKVVGIRLFGVRPESLLGTLGLENGDRLQSINGFEMSDPQKALEAYARLRTADKLQVSVNRRGKPMTIDFNIK
ncbi:type II secretion system protein GspC [Polyangium jinanense]|uniref:General secretion pathway protein GspC n=1 Tax=Polyangium jinanense TaxID=2829994 RepID=A0A9X3WYA8_9BACT|nr:type II secretion system protein GspC [Polyangium jinanense]MDC3952929.1 general secretion pathway protein GspC [Polyangium jinanense]MDC3980547.1 general secretion pathway protein GspC [Polyangium jinanense]